MAGRGGVFGDELTGVERGDGPFLAIRTLLDERSRIPDEDFQDVVERHGEDDEHREADGEALVPCHVEEQGEKRVEGSGAKETGERRQVREEGGSMVSEELNKLEVKVQMDHRSGLDTRVESC